MTVSGKLWVKNGHYIMWHHVLQPPVHVLLELRTGLVLPRQCSWPHFVNNFELPQQVPSNVVIAATGIGPIEHEGEDVHTKFMAYLGGVLKPFNQWRQRPTGFHEDGTQAGEEAGLQVAHTG